jgi:uncharacterized membrane protein YbaN (DUF454 family)
MKTLEDYEFEQQLNNKKIIEKAIREHKENRSLQIDRFIMIFLIILYFFITISLDFIYPGSVHSAIAVISCFMAYLYLNVVKRVLEMKGRK